MSCAGGTTSFFSGNVLVLWEDVGHLGSYLSRYSGRVEIDAPKCICGGPCPCHPHLLWVCWGGGGQVQCMAHATPSKCKLMRKQRHYTIGTTSSTKPYRPHMPRPRPLKGSLCGGSSHRARGCRGTECYRRQGPPSAKRHRAPATAVGRPPTRATERTLSSLKNQPLLSRPKLPLDGPATAVEGRSREQRKRKGSVSVKYPPLPPSPGTHWKGGRLPPPPPPPGRPALVPLTPSASLNGICNRQQPPPTALATPSNRLPNRLWGRL